MFLEEERSTTLPLSFDPVYYEKMRQVHEQNLQQWRVRQTGDTYVCHLSAKDGDRRLTCVKEWAINEGAQFARLPSPPQAGPSTVTESMQETGEGRGGTTGKGTMQSKTDRRRKTKPGANPEST